MCAFEKYPLYTHIPRWMRFVISGVITALVHLVFMYLLAEYLQWHYLPASSMAFLISLMTNFFLQKRLTFDDCEREGLAKKLLLFCAIAAFNLLLNGILMYLLVDVLMLWYMVAQCVVMVVIAVLNYLLYGAFVFRARTR